MTFRAEVSTKSIKVEDVESGRVFLSLDEIPVSDIPLEIIADILSDNGWEQVSPWVGSNKIQPIGTWFCEVSQIPTNDDNMRRADLAIALAEEDHREGESRDIRERVESALDFERDMRDRREHP